MMTNKRFIAIAGSVFIAVGMVTVVVVVWAKILFWTGPDDDQSGTHTPKSNNNNVTTGGVIGTTCDTPACKRWADAVKKSLDTSVEPCDNFYRFACGNFIKTTGIPQYAEEVDAFSTTRYAVEKQLKESVEEPTEDGEPEAFKKVKTFYEDCMDTDRMEEMGLTAAKKRFEEVGGWPVLEGDDWNEDLFHWPEMIYKTNELAFNTNALIKIYVTADVKHSTRRVINVQSGTFYSDKLGKWTRSGRGYFTYLVDVAVAYGAEPERARREAEHALDFEILLNKHAILNGPRPNITALYNKITLRQLQERYPSIPWLEYVNNHLPEGITVNSHETVILRNPKYFKYLEHALNYTKKRVLANYIAWRTAAATAKVLTDELRGVHLKYLNVLKGVTQEPKRWQTCAYYVKILMPNLASAMYVRRYFSSESKSEAVDILKYVRDEFGKILRGSDWMDEETKAVALEKFRAIEFRVGYPEELLDDDVLARTYEKIEIVPGDFFTSYLNLLRFNADFRNALLRKPAGETDWTSDGAAITVNAFYKLTENALVFPAAVLQGQFFDLGRPRYMNFGSLGSLMGHEITHSLDDLGRQFDAEGNFKDLWTVDTKKAFADKVECFVHQYDGYRVPEVDLMVNGARTQGENIADNGGASEAYLAYQSWLKDNPPEPLLPGLNYTQNQMFWISLAMNWCQTVRTQRMTHHVTNDPHAPSEYRVIGPLSNTEEFSRDFRCPTYAPMNRWHKCKLW